MPTGGGDTHTYYKDTGSDLLHADNYKDDDDTSDYAETGNAIANVTRIRPWTSYGNGRRSTSLDPDDPQTVTVNSAYGRVAQRDDLDDAQPTSWSLTEARQVDSEVRSDFCSDDDEFDADEEAADIIAKLENNESEQNDLLKRVTDRVGNGNRVPTKDLSLERWLLGESYASDEYDTDLEEDFPPEPSPIVDASGAHEYEVCCQRAAIVPVSFLMDNLGEGNLRMRYRYLGGHGTRPLAAALKKNTVCEEVDLSDNCIEGEGAAALARTLKGNMFIVNLNISQNVIKSKGATAFAEMLECNTTLKTLSLKGNELENCDAKRLSEALRNNTSLSCLDLSYNNFGELAGIHIANGLASNYGLTDLDLSWNNITLKGAVAIGKALAKNTSLEVLDLSWNGLGLIGGIAIGNALKHNSTLRVLDISNNNINNEAAKKIATGLSKNEKIETILLGMNPIGHEGIAAIIKTITVNPRLKLVGLEGCMSVCIESDAVLCKRIEEITNQRDILIMYASNRPLHTKINRTILTVFDRFVSDNAERMQDLFNQMDKDHSGDITLEEFKYGLRDFGLRLTSKQLDLLLDELDSDRSGTIEFEELMNGSMLVKQEKDRLERAEKEIQRFQEMQIAS